MAIPAKTSSSSLVQDVIQAFDNVHGYCPGFRPAHAKGILFSGSFEPSSEAKSLTKAPHMQNSPTPLTIRFSDFAGIPDIADNDSNGASPRGIAVRFNLAAHVHTDIIAHSTDGFPSRTAEDFVGFLRAIHESPPTAPHPTAIETYLGRNPAALRFVETPKPIPVSFVKENYFGVSALKFTNSDGISRFGRFRVRPEDSTEYLDTATAGAKTVNFLMDEIKERVAGGNVKLQLWVQLATSEDITDDSTVKWPEERPHLKLGSIIIQKHIPDDDREAGRIIFDPIPRVDGIEPSNDPLLQARADVYLATGRRRREALPK